MLMKYYKYADDYGFVDDGITHLEVDNGWAIRQITVNDDVVYASNVSYPPWGLRLADQSVDFDEIDEVIPISKQEFDEIWNKHLRQRQDFWEQAKTAYQIGRTVQGYIEIFFPQGVIVNLGKSVLGVANPQECRASIPPQLPLSSFHKITAVVTGYEEVNQWLVLGSPQVYQEMITLEEMNDIRRGYKNP
jgi:hypothetical protein